MEILGIGPMELFFIAILALILMGPKDMAKAGKTLGRWLNNFIHSETWQALRDTSKTISTLPGRLMREANLEDMQQELSIDPAATKKEKREAMSQSLKEGTASYRPNRQAVASEPTLIPTPATPPIATETEEPPAPKKTRKPATKSAKKKPARKPAASTKKTPAKSSTKKTTSKRGKKSDA